MPNPESTPGRSVSMTDAPGGDFSFDTLFPGEEGIASPESPSATGEPTPAQPAATSTPEQPAVPEFFLKTPTGTVYRTREEAEQGYAHKDTLLETMRTQLTQLTGVDPLTGKVREGYQQPQQRYQPQQHSQPEPLNYAANPQKYYEDLTEAVSNQDSGTYARIQAKFMEDYLAPIVPTITAVARTNAQQEVTGQLPDFHQVSSSQQYRDVLADLPDLKQAIEFAESNPAMSHKLPGFYRTAYWAAKGRMTPDLVQQAARQAQTATVPTTPTRPAMQTSTMTPPQQQSARPSMQTSAGRKQLIAEAEAKGVLDRLF